MALGLLGESLTAISGDKLDKFSLKESSLTGIRLEVTLPRLMDDIR